MLVTTIHICQDRDNISGLVFPRLESQFGDREMREADSSESGINLPAVQHYQSLFDETADDFGGEHQLIAAAAELDTDPVDAAVSALQRAEIARNGNVVTARLGSDTIIDVGTFGADRIRFRATTTFTDESTPGTIHLTGINGLAVDPGPGLPWISITSIRITGNQATIGLAIGVPITFELPPGTYDNIRQTLFNAGVIRIQQ